MKFPRVLYVYMEKDGNEIYPISNVDFNDIADNMEIGIYELKEKKVVVVERKLV